MNGKALSKDEYTVGTTCTLSVATGGEDINELKLSQAGELIRSGMYGISDAAELSGFADLSYFSREFKKHFNITPSEYRKASRK